MGKGMRSVFLQSGCRASFLPEAICEHVLCLAVILHHFSFEV